VHTNFFTAKLLSFSEKFNKTKQFSAADWLLKKPELLEIHHR